ncbi:MAG TPA: hypothetical protein VFA07_17260 [Chthonomonadaceae bacterium]|nr:hypothetical protein [Chthonomonadaceae bacterium]
MLGILFKLFGMAIAIVLIVFLATNNFRSARRLDTRIRQFKKEQEELEKQQGPINPYAALAEVYAEQNSPPARSTKSRRR